jgi:hypothetical protein
MEEDSGSDDYSDFEDVRDPDLPVKIESVTSKAIEIVSRLKTRGGSDVSKLKDKFGTIKTKSTKIAKETLMNVLDENGKGEVEQIQKDSENILGSIKALGKSEEIVELKNEFESLGKEVTTSEEAKRLTSTSKRLIHSVESSDTGKTILSAVAEVLEDRGDEFLLTADELFEDAASSTFSNHGTKSGEEKVRNLLKKTQKNIIVIGNDDEKKKILNAGLKQASAVTKNLSALTSRLKDDTNISESVKKKIQWIKENKIGQTAIQGVTDVLEAVDKRGVDRSVEDAKKILLDPESREQFFVSIKNAALAYLMEYLPKVKVPNIVDTKDGVDYELSDIKISGFRVPADDVSLIVVRNSELHLRAKNIVFDVKGIKWTYV